MVFAPNLDNGDREGLALCRDMRTRQLFILWETL